MLASAWYPLREGMGATSALEGAPMLEKDEPFPYAQRLEETDERALAQYQSLVAACDKRAIPRG